MSKPKISLITCSYFRPDLLRRAIQSVQKQTFQDYEHIIISDHDPFTEHVYNDFKEDSRIKFFEVEKPYIYNLGAVSFNLGIEKAQSEYICYLLDDDILYENHLEEHYNHLQTSYGNPIHLRYDTIVFKEPTNTVKNIVSTHISDLYEMVNKVRIEKRTNEGNFDVSAISHLKNIQTRWTPQCDLGGWEDNVFMSKIGINKKIGPYTNCKVSWGGIHRKDTKGLDPEYYSLLMSKLVKDDNTYSGYSLNSDSPYVYPKLKNTLYGN